MPDLRQPSYPSGIHPNTVPSPTARDTPTGSPFADVLTVIDALSMELHRLRAELEPLKAEVMPLKAEVAALTRERISDKEQIESLRASLGDLEEIVFREISVSPKKKKDQKNTTAVDVPNRHRSMQHQAEFEQNSPEEDSASDEEDFSRPNAKGAAVTGLIEQVTRRPEFKNLVSYRTYRLSDTTQKANAAVSGKLSSQLKQLRHYVDYKFTGDPAIQVIDFLRSFKEAADLNRVSEAAAAVLLPYFLDSRAKSGLYSRMKHITASMPKFPAAVQWLLQSFATEAVIAASYQKVFTARQMVGEDEKQYATRLNQYAAEAGSVFTEDSLISAFVDGLHPYASNNVRGQVTPTMMFAEVQLLAEQAGTASRALTSLSRAPPRVGHPAMNPSRSRPVVAAAVESYTRDADMYYDRMDGN